mmetsp:Transcript_9662/g.18134  ORF Transcript_9662/g.18134 Transcript_9662/m.18134 type:complete len:426 (+) Transcript_9662:165-1442(+)
MITKICSVHYTSRDTILYAFGIGCNPEEHDEKEIRYLYENDVQFSVFPTFPLTLLFRAVPITTARRRNTSSSCGGSSADEKKNEESRIVQEEQHNQILAMFSMPAFPPPSMFHSITDFSSFVETGTIGSRRSASTGSKSNATMIHLGQRLWIHSKIPNAGSARTKNPIAAAAAAVKVDIESHIISMRPYQQKGMIVTTESRFYDTTTTTHHKRLFATSQMIALYLSSSPSLTYTENGGSFIPPSSTSTFPSITIPKLRLEETKFKQQPFVKRYVVSRNQALLYRLSGDTNRIHVEGTSEGLFPTIGGRPILHGLCTLGYATRAVLSTFRNNDSDDEEEETNYIDCRFTLPLCVGESIEVRMWQVNGSMEDIMIPDEGTRLILFQVVAVKTGQIVVDGGIVGLVRPKGDSSQCGKTENQPKRKAKL